jgi:Holliday junction resolvasome RuvABC ATP-dependent DNA helicase subunit
MTQNKQHTLWVERYRPVDLENYIGNEHLKTKVLIVTKCM